MVFVDKPAPEFESAAFIRGDYRNVRLSDYRGRWVVLFFYPGDFTFVCPTELTDLATSYGELNALGVEVLAVSTDSHHVHRAWHEFELSKMVNGGIPFPMIADAGGKIGALYNVYDETDGVDVRGRFIIDPEGKIQSIEVVPSAVGRNTEELIRQIKAIQLSRETGVATPSCWVPGQPTLKPGPELVGKVWATWKPPKVA